jgi:hypothetical protein
MTRCAHVRDIPTAAILRLRPDERDGYSVVRYGSVAVSDGRARIGVAENPARLVENLAAHARCLAASTRPRRADAHAGLPFGHERALPGPLP